EVGAPRPFSRRAERQPTIECPVVLESQLRGHDPVVCGRGISRLQTRVGPAVDVPHGQVVVARVEAEALVQVQVANTKGYVPTGMKQRPAAVVDFGTAHGRL